MEIDKKELKEILEEQREECQNYIFNLRKKIAEDTEKIRKIKGMITSRYNNLIK